jgi:hypothetical protein
MHQNTTRSRPWSGRTRKWVPGKQGWEGHAGAHAAS